MRKKEVISKRDQATKLVKELIKLDQNSVKMKIEHIDDIEILQGAIDECRDLKMETGFKAKFIRNMVEHINFNLEERAKKIGYSPLHTSGTNLTKVIPLEDGEKKTRKFTIDDEMASGKLFSQAEDLVENWKSLDEKSIISKIKAIENVQLLKKAISACAIFLSEFGFKGITKPEANKVRFISKSLSERVKELENLKADPAKKA